MSGLNDRVAEPVPCPNCGSQIRVVQTHSIGAVRWPRGGVTLPVLQPEEGVRIECEGGCELGETRTRMQAIQKIDELDRRGRAVRKEQDASSS